MRSDLAIFHGPEALGNWRSDSPSQCEQIRLLDPTADLVANDTPCVDPSPFQLSFLLDGSRIEVGEI